MDTKLLFSVFFLAFCSVVCSQSQRELYNQSTAAYKTKDFSGFLSYARKLDSLRPAHPTYTYNLAAAYALNNQKDQALSVLKKLILMNNAVDFEKDSDFSNLHDLPGFKMIVQLKSDLAKTVAHSEKVTSLSEKDLHPEGLLFLTKQKIWLAASIRKKKIVAFAEKTGRCTDWFSQSDLSVFAMKADSSGKYLWVTTSAMPEMTGFEKAVEGKAEVLKIDIATKKVIKRFPLEGSHVLGDLTVAKTGEVFISDSGEAAIYRIFNDKIELWQDLQSEAYNLQGITLNDNSSKIFIADYLKGILMIDLKNPQNRKWLQFPENTTFKGIDGLVFYNNSLFAIHNGVKPIRVIEYKLTEGQNAISGYKVIDQNRPEFNEPALAAVANDALYFFGNSPWQAYDKAMNLDESKFENPVLYKFPLDK